MNVSVDRPTINTSVSGAHSSENRIEKDTFPIPDDVIIEIFSRLSVKVIARCRCVSKLWGSILRSKDFTDFFLIKSSARPHLLFLCRRLDRILFLSSHPPQNPDENSSPIDTSYDTSFPLNISQICRPINGLTCVVYLRTHYKGRKETVHVICNLCTRQSVSLCKVETWKTGVRSYFGYDPIEKQYKVLCREDKVSGEYRVLTLSQNGKSSSWRKIKCCINSHFTRHKYSPTGICINGVLYYKPRSMRIKRIP